MSKLIVLLMALVLLLSGHAIAQATEVEGLQHDVLVLFTSDVHCGIDQNFGYAGLQAVRDAAVAAGDHVLLMDDGDSVQGEPIGILTRGEAIIGLMNGIGYDAAIPGNHEFDYGMEQFLKLADMAKFPYISYNFARNGELVLDPYIIRAYDGVKIAFVGVTTPKTLTTSSSSHFKDEDGNFIYGFSQGGDGSALYAAVQQAVDAARAEGADYVFLMAHLGNEASVAPYTYADVLSHTTGIDAMLDGHSHDSDKVIMKNAGGKNVIRQACGTKLESIGWLRISAADGSVDTGLYTWNNDVPAPELLGIWNGMRSEVAAASAVVDAYSSTVIAVSNVDLMSEDPVAVDASGKPVRLVRCAETNLGDLCADAFRDQTGADVGLANGGSIRRGIPRGDITMAGIMGTYPFGNRICVIEATGRQILNALEYAVSDVPSENGAFLQASGLTYEIHTYIDSGAIRDDDGMYIGVRGEYRVKNVLVNGEPLDLEKKYTVATQTYTGLDHGDGTTAFDGAKLIGKTEQTDYELVANYIVNTLGGIVGEGYENPYGSGRIVAVEEPAKTPKL